MSDVNEGQKVELPVSAAKKLATVVRDCRVMPMDAKVKSHVCGPGGFSIINCPACQASRAASGNNDQSSVGAASGAGDKNDPTEMTAAEALAIVKYARHYQIEEDAVDMAIKRLEELTK